MNAKEAAAKAEQARKKQEKERERWYKAQKIAAAKERLALSRAARRYLPGIREKIAEAAARGLNRYTEECGESLGHAIGRLLKKDGYRYSTRSETREMGDNEYPHSSTFEYLTIEWGEPKREDLWDERYRFGR